MPEVIKLEIVKATVPILPNTTVHIFIIKAFQLINQYFKYIQKFEILA